MLSFLSDLPGVSQSRWGGVLLCVEGDRQPSVRERLLSHALLSAETLAFVRIPKSPPHI